jgi:hypothetical protein
VRTLASYAAANAAAVAAAGLRLAGRGAAAAEKAMQSALSVEHAALEARLAYLGTVHHSQQCGRRDGGRSDPFPPVPASVPGAEFEFVVPVSFNLTDAAPGG